MAITQIPISHLTLTAMSNDITIHQSSSDLSDRDEQRRREAKRGRNQMAPRMRQAQQEKQAKRLSEVMLKGLSPDLRASASLVSHRSLTDAMNDLLAEDGPTGDSSELMKAPESANTRRSAQTDTDQKAFETSEEADANLAQLLSNDEKVFEESEIIALGEKRPAEQFQPLDMAARLADLGSMQGKGKTNLAVRQMTGQLREMADVLAAQKKSGTELSEEESNQLAYSVDFLEGYCEASLMDAQTRAQFDASLQSLRANLNPVVQASVAEAVVANSDALEGIAKPVSVAGTKQRAAREALLTGVKEDSKAQSSAVMERNRRILLAQNDEKKQKEDTLSLLVQRSV